MSFVLAVPSVWNVLSPVLATLAFIIHISIQPYHFKVFP